jgi:hypothetical protein
MDALYHKWEQQEYKMKKKAHFLVDKSTDVELFDVNLLFQIRHTQPNSAHHTSDGSLKKHAQMTNMYGL